MPKGKKVNKIYVARLTHRGGESCGAFIWTDRTGERTMEGIGPVMAELEQMFLQGVYYNDEKSGEQIVVDISTPKEWVRIMDKATLGKFECSEVDVFVDEA